MNNSKAKFHFIEFYKNTKLLELLWNESKGKEISFQQNNILTRIYQTAVNNLKKFHNTPVDIQELSELKQISERDIPKSFICSGRDFCSHNLNLGKIFDNTKNSILKVLSEYIFDKSDILKYLGDITGINFEPLEYSELIESYKKMTLLLRQLIMSLYITII